MSGTEITSRAACHAILRPVRLSDPGAPLIFSGPYNSPIRLRKEPYKSREGPEACERRAASWREGESDAVSGRSRVRVASLALVRTMARWKSGFPLGVLANSVNCETQRTSPSISLTFFFHIAPDDSSEKTLSERLSPPVNYNPSAWRLWGFKCRLAD